MATNQNELFKKELTAIATGDFDISGHAVESFRIRIKKIFPKSAAAETIKELLMTGASNGTLSIYRSMQHEGWNLTLRGSKMDFEAALRHPVVPGQKDLVVSTIVRPWGHPERFGKEELNQRVTVQDYQKQRDDYERAILKLEDQIYEIENDPDGGIAQCRTRLAGVGEQLHNRLRQIERLQAQVTNARAEVLNELQEFLIMLRSNFEAADSPDDANLVDKLYYTVLQWDDREDTYE